MRRHLLGVAVVGLLLGACGDAPAPSASTPSTPDERPTVDDLLVVGCGLPEAGIPRGDAETYRDLGVETTPLTPDLHAAVEALTATIDGAFLAGLDFGIVEEIGDEAHLLAVEHEHGGLRWYPASFERIEPGEPTGNAPAAAGWRATSWASPCEALGVTAPGWTPSRLQAPGAPTPADARTFTLQAVENECNSGRPPTGREIVPIVEETASTVTITVLLEPGPDGDATCQGNPPFDVEVTLDAPLGDRELLDGRFFPALPPGADVITR